MSRKIIKISKETPKIQTIEPVSRLLQYQSRLTYKVEVLYKD